MDITMFVQNFFLFTSIYSASLPKKQQVQLYIESQEEKENNNKKTTILKSQWGRNRVVAFFMN